jgi:hypothetical protein
MRRLEQVDRPPVEEHGEIYQLVYLAHTKVRGSAPAHAQAPPQQQW